MSKSNTDFLEKKKDWSRVKDTLLGAYLPVYFSKVMHTGKLNHNKEVEKCVDWPKFREDAVSLLESFGSEYYIKEDLQKAV